MLETFWVLLLFPLIGSAVNGFLGKRLPAAAISGVACLSVLISFIISALAFSSLLGLPEDQRTVTVSLFTWIEAGGFVSKVSFLLDPLSSLMMLIVTGVGFLIHVYSIGYMKGEDGFARYFAYLNLFIFMMSLLVLADNYLMMFVGWEGVGLCSYLLIGYYFKERFAGDAAKKAFIFNRVGDVGFLLGLFLIFREFGTIEYVSLFSQVADALPGPEVGFGVVSLITLLLFIGATGKSAQIPLFVWLPDAMAGPTPVSALIHAATMVTAGIYMVARSGALFSRAPETLMIIAVVGLATAVVAALIAVCQTDIKKVLAYSTVSQLGYMFLACGVGAFASGIFHVMTHAFFKALLFLGSGSVILALHHEQNLFKMGGLRKYLPKTCWTMWIATAAIAGAPGLSGFFSKDEILWQAFSSPHGNVVFWIVGVLVAGLTAFYMCRMMFLAFHGEQSADDAGGDQAGDHHHAPREPGWVVTFPLIVLAVLSVVGGYVGLPAWLSEMNHHHRFLEPSFVNVVPETPHAADHALEMGLAAVTTLIGLGGIGLAYLTYVKRPDLPGQLAERFSGAYGLVRQKFLVDEMYDAVLIRPVHRISRGLLWRVIDNGIIDGIVNGTASMMGMWSQIVRRWQSGYVRGYATWILFGTALIVLYYSYFTNRG